MSEIQVVTWMSAALAFCIPSATLNFVEPYRKNCAGFQCLRFRGERAAEFMALRVDLPEWTTLKGAGFRVQVSGFGFGFRVQGSQELLVEGKAAQRFGSCISGAG